MNPRFQFQGTSVAYSCGLGVLGNFHLNQDAELGSIAEFRDYYFNWIEKRGTGYVVVAYIDTDLCRMAEELIKERGWKEVFRSEKRINKNSANEFWFVIYDYVKG